MEELTLQVGRMGTPRPVERNLSAELDERADDDEGDEEHGAAEGDRPLLFPKVTRNAATPMVMAQAKWLVLGAELTQPVRAANINQVVEETLLLSRVMGYWCNSRSNSLSLSEWGLSRAATELWQLRKKLRVAFGLVKDSSGAWPANGRNAEFEFSENPSRIPLPKTPETKKREVVRATEGSPDFEGSHMQTPVTLSFDKAEEDNTQYLKVRSHTSLDKIAEFDVEANSEEEESNRQPPSSYDSEGDWSLEDQSSGDDSAYDRGYVDTGFVSDNSRNTGRRENSARGRDDSSRDRSNSANRPSRPFDRRDQSNRRDGSHDRPL
ncbi:hypothetical protein GQ600_21880 [Phytophthora cactorum]|nr:hypothetical protein GQ600_21880 [Phytophthora cactorum]